MTSLQDVNTLNKDLISKTLSNLVKNIGLKDVANFNFVKEYTYIRKDYASRIDRLYVRNMYNHITSCNSIPISFSDHNMVLLKCDFYNMKTGRGIWKLNVTLLEKKEVKENFLEVWESLKLEQSKFSNIVQWWDYSKKR